MNFTNNDIGVLLTYLIFALLAVAAGLLYLGIKRDQKEEKRN
jgi:hypothetical protein